MNELVSSVQGILPTIVSAYQKAPWAFWLLGILLIAMVVYFATLPRRRREFLRRNFAFYSRRKNEDWQLAYLPFPGIVSYRRFGIAISCFKLNGDERELSDIQTMSRRDDPAGIGAWNRDWSDSNGIDWLVVKLEHPSRRLPRWPLAITGILFFIGLVGWFVIRAALERRAEPEQTKVCEINEAGEWINCVVVPTTPAPLAAADDIIPAPAASPTPQPERVDPYSIVVDLDKPAGPGELEQMLNALADKLPVFPDIIPEWIEFGAAKHPTQIASLEGMEGFVIVFATDSGLELHRTSDELVKVGETLYISDYRATLIARDATKGVGYDEDAGEWLETIDYPRGKVRVLVTQHGHPALQVVSSGLVAYNHRPWHIPVAVVGVILTVAFLVWLRRR